jgi:hypothetical protein
MYLYAKSISTPSKFSVKISFFWIDSVVNMPSNNDMITPSDLFRTYMLRGSAIVAN